MSRLEIARLHRLFQSSKNDTDYNIDSKVEVVDKRVSNIKTINGESLLGGGNLEIGGGSFSGTMDDIDDGDTYVKTENNFSNDDKTKLDGLTGGLTQAQVLARGLGC